MDLASEGARAELVSAAKSEEPPRDLTGRERALHEFAVKLTKTPGSMTQEDLVPLRQSGLDDAGILDVCQVVAYFNYINRLADGLGVDLEAFMPPPKK